MIETRRLKNVMIFIQRVLGFVLSRRIVNIDIYYYSFHINKHQTLQIRQTVRS